MTKYAVTYTEILVRTLIVEAEDREEAQDIVRYLVDGCTLVLDSDDMSDYEYEVEEATPDVIDFFDDVDDLFEDEVREYRGDMED